LRVRRHAGPGICRRHATPGRRDRQWDGRLRLPAREPRRDARPLSRAGRHGDAPDRATRVAADADRGAARIVSGVRPPSIPPGLDTPRLVVDLDVVERNVARLQAAMDERGVRLRPHAKTHKSVRIARLQLAAGAHGITVGTLGEAEVMADGGIDDLFIAYPVWAEGSKAERLRALHDRPDVRI